MRYMISTEVETDQFIDRERQEILKLAVTSTITNNLGGSKPRNTGWRMLWRAKRSLPACVLVRVGIAPIDKLDAKAAA